MTKSERTDLAALVRRRERLMKSAAASRASEVMADFERQLATIYSFDDDAIWKGAALAAKEACTQASQQIDERCEVLGIPKEFRPKLGFYWLERGENLMADRRRELRRVAKTRIAAQEREAKTAIEQWSVDTQTKLVADGLTSEGAHAFLEAMPTVDGLLPAFGADDIMGLVPSSKRSKRCHPNLRLVQMLTDEDDDGGVA